MGVTGNYNFEGATFDTGDQAFGPVIGVLGTDGKVYTLKVDPVSGKLKVEATISGVAEINLDYADDEVTVAGSSDGGTTRHIVKTDTAGRVAVDATLQLADTDVSTSNPVPVSDAGASLTVDNPVLSVVGGGVEASALRVTLASDGSGLVSVDDNGGSLTVDNPALSVVGGGTEATAQRVTIASDSTGVLSVDDNGGLLSVDDGGGSLTVDGSVSVTGSVTVAQPTASSLNAEVQGDAAHGAALSGNPLLTGAAAVAHGANPTAVAAGQVTRLQANRAGVLFVTPGHPNLQTWEYNTTAAQTHDNVLAAIATGTKYVITEIIAAVDEACTVGVGFRMGFGATTVPTEGASGADAVAGVIASHPGLVPGDVYRVGGGGGIAGIGGDGEELRITCDAPTTGKLSIIVKGYTIES